MNLSLNPAKNDRAKLSALKADIAIGIEQIKNGESEPLDIDGMMAELDEEWECK